MSTTGKGKPPTKKELQAKLEEMQTQLQSLTRGTACMSTAGLIVGAPSAESKSSVSYTSQMVAALLEIRYGFLGDAFRKSTSNAQRAILWEKLTLRFNIATQQSVESLSLKNKINNLRREYTREYGQLKRPQETPRSIPSKPPSLGDIEYGEETMLQSPDVDETTSFDHDTDETAEQRKQTRGDKRIREVDEEIGRQRKARGAFTTKKQDVAAGLVSLGDSLAKALVDSATISVSNNSTDDSIVRVMSETNKQLENISNLLTESKKSQDKANDLNAKLLEFMQARMP
ncbi:hypothetical protein AC1031_010902 [Aphanomyces cochlioides]|nr:hypothetical protein AC1031_010902 [Aphanomyces cochlioides]